MSHCVSDYLELLECRSSGARCTRNRRLDCDLARLVTVMTPDEIAPSWRPRAGLTSRIVTLCSNSHPLLAAIAIGEPRALI